MEILFEVLGRVRYLFEVGVLLRTDFHWLADLLQANQNPQQLSLQHLLFVRDEPEAAVSGQVAFVVGGLADRIPEHEATVHHQVGRRKAEQIADQLVQVVLNLLWRVLCEVLLGYFGILLSRSDL